MTGAALRDILGARNVVFYNTKSSPRSDRVVFLLAEALQGVSAEILSFKISWQAQYLVRLG